MAIYAIALHAAFATLVSAPLAQAAFDPLAITCLHQLETEQAPANDPAAHVSCDHCVLCAASPPPAAPLTVAALLIPARLASVIRPAAAPAAFHQHNADPGRARAPPPNL